jgi:Tol biopolymer transport system component
LTEGFVSQLPAVSPDGKWIAYFYFEENAPVRLAVIPFEGGQPVKTFELPPTFHRGGLRWNPDGRAIAYTAKREGGSNVWAQPLEGGAPKQLTGFKSDEIFRFDWSRDGKQLTLARGTVTNDVVLISNFRSPQ